MVNGRTVNPLLTVEGIIAAAHRIYPGDPVRAELSATQAILESGLASNRGPSGLARRANNLFGIKGTGNAGSITMPTREVVGGRDVMMNEPFAAYLTPEDSLLAHQALMQRPRYVNAGVGSARTFEEAAQAVARAGYATDPNYAQALIRVRQQFVASASMRYLTTSPYFNPVSLEPHVLETLEQASGGAHRDEVTQIRSLLNDPNAQRMEGLRRLSELNRRLLVQAGVAAREADIPFATFHLAQKFGAPLAAAIHHATDPAIPIEQLESDESRRGAVRTALAAYVRESRAILSEERLAGLQLSDAERARLNQILGLRSQTPAVASAPGARGAATPAAEGQETTPPAEGQAAPSNADTPEAPEAARGEASAVDPSTLTVADMRLLARARSEDNHRQVEHQRERTNTHRRHPDGRPMTNTEAAEEDRRWSGMLSGLGDMGIGGLIMMMIIGLLAPGLLGIFGQPSASPPATPASAPGTPPGGTQAPGGSGSPAAPDRTTSLPATRGNQFAALLDGQVLVPGGLAVQSHLTGEYIMAPGARGTGSVPGIS